MTPSCHIGSHNCLIFMIEILIPGKTVFILRRGPSGEAGSFRNNGHNTVVAGALAPWPQQCSWLCMISLALLSITMVLTTCVISRSDKKCKYIFIFPENITARKGLHQLIIIVQPYHCYCYESSQIITYCFEKQQLKLFVIAFQNFTWHLLFDINAVNSEINQWINSSRRVQIFEKHNHKHVTEYIYIVNTLWMTVTYQMESVKTTSIYKMRVLKYYVENKALSETWK